MLWICCLDPRGGARADAHHGDHRRHADDDAQHRERRTRAVHLQRPQRDPDAGDDFVHAEATSSGWLGGKLLQILPRIARLREPLVQLQPAVFEVDVPVGVARDIRIVRHHDHGDPLVAVQPLEDRHDLDAGS